MTSTLPLQLHGSGVFGPHTMCLVDILCRVLLWLNPCLLHEWVRPCTIIRLSFLDGLIPSYSKYQGQGKTVNAVHFRMKRSKFYVADRCLYLTNVYVRVSYESTKRKLNDDGPRLLYVMKGCHFNLLQLRQCQETASCSLNNFEKWNFFVRNPDIIWIFKYFVAVACQLSKSPWLI